MSDPIIRRGQIRPISELPDATTPAFVEVEDADGTMRHAVYGGGGGGDPWDEYGTPLKRWDFTDPASLNDWTAVLGSKTSIAFLNVGDYRGGSWSTSGNVWLTTPAPPGGVPFVFDVRMCFTRPATARWDAGLGIEGPSVQRTLYTALMASTFDAGILNTRRFSGTFQIPGVASNSYHVTLGNRWFTLRCHFDGTNYRYMTCDGPPWMPSMGGTGYIQPAVGGIGLPVNLMLIYGIAGTNVRLRFAQLQVDNVDDWVGM